MSDPLINALHDLHQKAEAEFQAYGDVEIPLTFGEPQAEYAAIRKGCAILDLAQRAVLEVAGKDRLDFLNRFITNQTWDKQSKTGMAAGTGVYGFLLNNKGRVVTDANFLELGDRTLVELDRRNLGVLHSTLEKFVFSEQVKFTSRAGDMSEIALHGPKAADILFRAGATNLPGLGPLGSVQVLLWDVPTVVWRDDPAGVPGLHLIVPSAEVKTIWLRFLSEFSTPDPAGAQALKRQLWPAGWAAFNSTRIEAGRAIFGIDFDDTMVPAETGQIARAVSFTKGCYLGQEIVARMHARGQVAKQIVGIRMDSGALPMAGAAICDDKQNQVGGITSSTMSPILSNAAIALGIVKKQFMAPGSKVIVPAEGEMRGATVEELPFVK